MSLDYTFRKQDIPLETWLEKIDDIFVSSDNQNVPEGKWRELLVSNMLRNSGDDDQDTFAAKFITEGSIRGVLVSEGENEIEIKLHSFASRSDQYLAARMAMEAMTLGANVTRDRDGTIKPEDLTAEVLDAIHREWFALSRASILQETEASLPIYDFLSLAILPSDGTKEDDVLERDLINRLALMGDAYVSSQLVIGIAGFGNKTASILQPDMSSLVMKDVDGVVIDKNIIPIDVAVKALGDEVRDGKNCWIFPPVTNIDPTVLQSMAAKSFTAGGAESTNTEGPTEEEWNFIAQGPVLAFLLVAGADGKVDKKEVEGFGKVLTGLAAQQDHPSVARMMSTALINIQEILPRLISGKVNAAQMMQALAMLLNERFDAKDARYLKAALLFLAQEVASSSGGLFGFGSKISKDEKVAINSIATLLGIS